MKFFATLLPFILVISQTGYSEPLTQDQKQRLKNLTESYAKLQVLTGSFLNTDKKNFVKNLQVMAEKNDLPPIDESTCEIDLPVDEFGELKAGEDLKIPTFKVEIHGDTCPVYILGSIGGEQKNENSFTATFQWIYEGKHGSYKDEYDINQVQLKGTITGELIPAADGMSMKMEMLLEGDGVSQLEGSFINRVVGNYEFGVKNLEGSSGTKDLSQLMGGMINVEIKGLFSQKFQLNFAEVNAEAEERTIIEGILDMRQEHYLNKDLVTAEEYQEYMKDIVFPGMSDGSGGTPPSGGSAKEFAGVCQVNGYDKKVVSKAQAEERFSQGLPIMQPPVAFFNSCMNDDQFTHALGRPLSTKFLNNKDHMQVSLQFMDVENAPVTEFFVLEEQDLALVESNEGLTVTIQCYSQQRCQ